MSKISFFHWPLANGCCFPERVSGQPACFARRLDKALRKYFNTKFKGPWTILFSHQDQLELAGDNLLTTLPILTKEWMIDFKIKATNLDHENWTSIIHMREDGASHRIPALFSNTSRVQVCFRVNGNPNYQDTISGLKVNKWTHILISQYGSRFKVVVGGRDEINVENTQPSQFENVKVWATPPGSHAQPGYIKDLSIRVKL